MKKGIHPPYYTNAKVISEGKIVFETGSTLKEIKVDVWSGNHPFYTGKQRIIDTENLVKKFEGRTKAANMEKVAKKKEKVKSRSQKTTNLNSGKQVTLKDLLGNLSK